MRAGSRVRAFWLGSAPLCSRASALYTWATPNSDHGPRTMPGRRARLAGQQHRQHAALDGDLKDLPPQGAALDTR